MPSLQIRNLPDDLYQALLFRAEQAHRSLAQQALIELRRATGDGAGSKRARILEAVKGSLAASRARKPIAAPEALIRADRNR